jgi:hypothetical protein
MAQDEIFVADAADFIGKSRGKRLINQAWKQKTIRLRGVRPGESEPVEIPFNEGGRVDCKKSRIVMGRLCTTYLSVTMKWPEVRRLAQADVERLGREAKEVAASAAPWSKQGRQSPTHPAIGPAGEAEREKSVTLAEALASELSRLYPTGRPAKRRAELMERVRKAVGEKLGVFELTTLDRAMRLLGWTTRRPKRAEPPPQPPR